MDDTDDAALVAAVDAVVASQAPALVMPALVQPAAHPAVAALPLVSDSGDPDVAMAAQDATQPSPSVAPAACAPTVTASDASCSSSAALETASPAAAALVAPSSAISAAGGESAMDTSGELDGSFNSEDSGDSHTAGTVRLTPEPKLPHYLTLAYRHKPAVPMLDASLSLSVNLVDRSAGPLDACPTELFADNGAPGSFNRYTTTRPFTHGLLVQVDHSDEWELQTSVSWADRQRPPLPCLTFSVIANGDCAVMSLLLADVSARNPDIAALIQRWLTLKSSPVTGLIDQSDRDKERAIIRAYRSLSVFGTRGTRRRAKRQHPVTRSPCRCHFSLAHVLVYLISLCCCL